MDLTEIAGQIDSTMDSAIRALQKATSEAVAGAGRIAREELLRTAPLAAGPDGRYSHAGAAGRLQVRLRQDADDVTVSPRGLWGVAETGADPHTALAWGRHPFAHPGVLGRHAWSIGRDAAFTRLDRELIEAIGPKVEQAFAGG